MQKEFPEAEVFETFELDEWKPKMLIIELEDEHPSFQKYEDLVNRIKDLRGYILSKGYREIFKDHINTVFYYIIILLYYYINIINILI